VIRTNLSTRPFYNERLVGIWLTVFAAIAAGATLFNVSRLIRYSRSDTELTRQADRDETRAAELRATAARLRTTVDVKQIDSASAEARQANELIDRRTFSWTELLNVFETTLPPEVRITSVRPRALEHRAGTLLDINVVSRSVDDVNAFMQNLVKSGAFSGVRPVEEHENDQGQWESSLAAVYTFGMNSPEGGARPR
jgi:Tfp pilus assembly protein PilN